MFILILGLLLVQTEAPDQESFESIAYLESAKRSIDLGDVEKRQFAEENLLIQHVLRQVVVRYPGSQMAKKPVLLLPGIKQIEPGLVEVDGKLHPELIPFSSRLSSIMLYTNDVEDEVNQFFWKTIEDDLKARGFDSEDFGSLRFYASGENAIAKFTTRELQHYLMKIAVLDPDSLDLKDPMVIQILDEHQFKQRELEGLWADNILKHLKPRSQRVLISYTYEKTPDVKASLFLREHNQDSLKSFKSTILMLKKLFNIEATK